MPFQIYLTKRLQDHAASHGLPQLYDLFLSIDEASQSIPSIWHLSQTDIEQLLQQYTNKLLVNPRVSALQRFFQFSKDQQHGSLSQGFYPDFIHWMRASPDLFGTDALQFQCIVNFWYFLFKKHGSDFSSAFLIQMLPLYLESPERFTALVLYTLEISKKNDQYSLFQSGYLSAFLDTHIENVQAIEYCYVTLKEVAEKGSLPFLNWQWMMHFENLLITHLSHIKNRPLALHALLTDHSKDATDTQWPPLPFAHLEMALPSEEVLDRYYTCFGTDWIIPAMCSKLGWPPVIKLLRRINQSVHAQVTPQNTYCNILLEIIQNALQKDMQTMLMILGELSQYVDYSSISAKLQEFPNLFILYAINHRLAANIQLPLSPALNCSLNLLMSFQPLNDKSLVLLARILNQVDAIFRHPANYSTRFSQNYFFKTLYDFWGNTIANQAMEPLDFKGIHTHSSFKGIYQQNPEDAAFLLISFLQVNKHLKTIETQRLKLIHWILSGESDPKPYSPLEAISGWIGILDIEPIAWEKTSERVLQFHLFYNRNPKKYKEILNHLRNASATHDRLPSWIDNFFTLHPDFLNQLLLDNTSKDLLKAILNALNPEPNGSVDKTFAYHNQVRSLLENCMAFAVKHNPIACDTVLNHSPFVTEGMAFHYLMTRVFTQRYIKRNTIVTHPKKMPEHFILTHFETKFSRHITTELVNRLFMEVIALGRYAVLHYFLLDSFWNALPLNTIVQGYVLMMEKDTNPPIQDYFALFNTKGIDVKAMTTQLALSDDDSELFEIFDDLAAQPHPPESPSPREKGASRASTAVFFQTPDPTCADEATQPFFAMT